MYIKIVKNADLKFYSIKKNLYDIKDNIEVISRFVPIKYHEMYFLVVPLNNLEGLFLEKNNHVIEVFIIYNNNKKSLKLKNRTCIYNEDYNNDILYDCYFDIYQNLLLINVCKKKLNSLEFINLDGYDILEYFSYNYDNLNLKVNTNKLNIFEKINIENKFFWDEKFILFPEVPYIKFQTENGFILSGSEIIGSNIEDSSVEKLFGITYKCEFDEDTNKYEYKVIPIFGILKSLKMILGQKYLLLGIDLQVQVINNINDEILYCLVNDETFYNIYETKDYAGNNIKITTKIFDKNTLIYKIDNYKIDKNGYLDMNGIKIPIKSYIWYFKELDNDNYYNLKYHKLKINALGIKFIEIETKIYNNKNFSINLSDFNYINYKNKLIFELNESLLYLIRDYLFQNDTYKYFIDFIIKNKYKNNKIIVGMEIISDTINFINNLFKQENNTNNNFEIKIINNSILIQPKIFLIKKYNSIQEILNNFKEKKKLLVLIESLFNLHQKINKKIFS